MRKLRYLCCALVLLVCAGAMAQTPTPMTWEQVRQRFQQSNPTLLAGKLNIDESKAQEITAFLRPNPNASFSLDQVNPFDGGPPHSCCGTLLTGAAFSYL